MPMNRNLGVWTSEECALVLIDYQEEQLESIRSETPADLVELHTRWLARTAKAFDVPSTSAACAREGSCNRSAARSPVST
jgi:hypothetical protein